MARIVVGAATPHGPQRRIPAERWPVLRERDPMDRGIRKSDAHAWGVDAAC